jgi:hypothetical protein
MARELDRIDIATLTTADLARVVDEVHRTRRPRVLCRDDQAVAMLSPVTEPPVSMKAVRSRRERLVIAERTAGIFHQYAKNPPPTPREEKDAFEQAVADQVMESMRD